MANAEDSPDRADSAPGRRPTMKDRLPGASGARAGLRRLLAMASRPLAWVGRNERLAAAAGRFNDRTTVVMKLGLVFGTFLLVSMSTDVHTQASLSHFSDEVQATPVQTERVQLAWDARAL